MRGLHALWRASIWHPDAIPVIEGRVAHELKRSVLPALDIVFLVMGISAVIGGMPSFDIVLNAAVSDAAAWGLLVAAVLALAGIAFPVLWALEAAGKIAIVAIIGGYAGALWFLAFTGEGSRAFVAGALTGLLIVPLWNLFRLGRERQAREAARAAGKEL